MTACAPRIRSSAATRIASVVGVALLLLACAASAQARVQPRIVGGSSAAITTFPFQVALWSPGAPSPFDGQFCGGAIRDATHVVTAAHCVWDDTSGQAVAPQSLHVLAGTAHLNASGDPPYGSEVKDVAVSATSFDPAYDPSTNDYDVAVLTLASPLYAGSPALDGTTNIARIPLIDSTQAQTFADPSSGSPVTVSGWGDTNAEPADGQPSPSYPQNLRAAQTHLVPDSTCQQDYSGQITARMICAGEPSGGVDSCFGDSGGPLVAQAHGSPAPAPPTDDVLVGLVDFGAGCAQAGLPGVYQRVVNAELSAFLTSNPPQAPQPTGAPTLSGSPSPGQTLTCGTGAWAGNPSSFGYRFGRDLGSAGALALTPSSASNSYTVQPGDAGTQIFCEVRAANAGGYAYADSDDVTVGSVGQGGIGSTPGPTAPVLTSTKDTKPPTLGVVARSCRHRRCVINVRAFDPLPSSGIRLVKAALRWRVKAACRRRGRRAYCSRTSVRNLRAKPIGGSHFVVSTGRLKPGTTYTLTLIAVDRAGHAQRRPTTWRLRVR